MSLFAYELKKILRRPLTLVVLTASLALIAVLNIANMQGTKAMVWGPEYYASLPEGSKEREKHQGREPYILTGREAIALTRQRSERFRGEWTDERVKEFATEYLAFLAREDIYDTNIIDVTTLWVRNSHLLEAGLTNEEIDAYNAENPLFQMKDEYLYSEEYLQLDTIGYALEYHLIGYEGNIFSLAEAYPGEPGPLYFEYLDGVEFWASIQQVMVGILAALLILVAMAPLFSEEVVRHTEPLLLSARHGRGKLVAAKLSAGVFFSAASLLLLSVFNFVINGLCFGFSGYGASCALGYVGAPAGMAYGQYVLYLVGLQLLGCVAFSCLLMLLSSVLSSPFPVLFCGAVFFLACLLGATFAPQPLAGICQLLPPAAMVPAIVPGVPVVAAANSGLTAACLAAIALRYKRKR